MRALLLYGNVLYLLVGRSHTKKREETCHIYWGAISFQPFLSFNQTSLTQKIVDNRYYGYCNYFIKIHKYSVYQRGAKINGDSITRETYYENVSSL